MNILVIACGCLAIGFCLGVMFSTKQKSDCISRFFMKDQRDAERAEAYWELAKRVGEGRNSAGVLQ